MILPTCLFFQHVVLRWAQKERFSRMFMLFFSAQLKWITLVEFFMDKIQSFQQEFTDLQICEWVKDLATDSYLGSVM